jgi:hypothetical protein
MMKDTFSSTDVSLTKIAAAQRQLDAAIRMTLAGEDELAVHTVGSAAYRLLRDIKERRGGSDLEDKVARGLFHMAKDTLAPNPKQAADLAGGNKILHAMLLDLAAAIRNGEVVSPKDVEVVSDPVFERRWWNTYNQTANYLKHADKDVKSMLSLSAVDNQSLLTAAVESYIDIMGIGTPEMVVIFLYYFGDVPDFRPPWWSAESARRYTSLESDARRHLCQAMLEEFKSL